jgi:hypothetical protein
MTIITKIMFDNIVVDDPISFLSNNIDRAIIKILEHKYVNKCYLSAYVLRITRIIRRGDCILNQNGVNDKIANPVNGTIYVQFETQCIVYNSGEIIPNCLVEETDEYNNIKCNSTYGGIHVKPDKYNSSIKVGQLISIVVENVMYDVLQPEIAIQGNLFIPKPVLIAYEIPENKDIDIAVFAPILERLKLEESDRSSRAWITFDKLIYPHKTEVKIANTISIIDIASKLPNNKNKYLVRDSNLHLTSPSVYYTDTPPEGAQIINKLNYTSIVLAVLFSYSNYSNLITEMCDIYNTPELITAHKNLWAIYASSRK